eukprot:5052263-Amphidinium_carterae.1
MQESFDCEPICHILIQFLGLDPKVTEVACAKAGHAVTDLNSGLFDILEPLLCAMFPGNDPKRARCAEMRHR